MRRRRHRRLVRLLAAAALAALLAGCRLDAVVELSVDRDGGGTYAVDLRADRALAERAAAAEVDPFAHVAERVRGLPGWDVRVREEPDGSRRLRLAARFRDAGELRGLTAAFAEALAAPELRPLESLTMERDGDAVRVRGVAGLDPRDGVAALGWTPEQATAALAEAVGYEVRVRLPGEVLDTNADRSADGVLVWAVPAGQRVEIWAEGALPSGDVLVLVAGGALAAVLSALWLGRRAGAGPVEAAVPPAEEPLRPPGR